ncbi:MAG: Gfo/Idh/MocA family oxidoreductase [Chloroflexi bacterium]|nr:Gfo/Idh/MocA family oxidoreductase [Chloroflexota bacterium]
MVVGKATRRINIGVIGIGVGGLEIIRSAVQQPETINLTAGCDVVPLTRERFQERFPDAKVYSSVDEICKDPNVDAVYIASPNRFHAEHTITAARNGKHVLIEKPMAISLKETEQMVDECERAGVKLVCAHTASFGLPYRIMRKVIQSGEIGQLKAITLLAYTDWMLRPRTPDELDFAQGGGVPFRQGPHQIDTVRLLGGGMIKNVWAKVGRWMPERAIPGYYTAHFEFEDGAVATATHNGYGYFTLGDINGPAAGRSSIESIVEVRKQMRAGTRDEAADKQELRIGGAIEVKQFEAAKTAGPGRGNFGRQIEREPGDRTGLSDTGDPGTIIVSCERGDMRIGPRGVFIYDDEGVREVTGESAVNARGEIHEMYEAVVNDKPVYHSGRWGMGTAEAIFAMVESSETGKVVELTHQIPVHPDYDADLTVVDL